MEQSFLQLDRSWPRRAFLSAGSARLFRLTLADILRAEDAAASEEPQAFIIIIWLTCGLSHIDSFDMKTIGSSDIQGQFWPIPANVSGIQVCELLPRLARLS